MNEKLSVIRVNKLRAEVKSSDLDQCREDLRQTLHHLISKIVSQAQDVSVTLRVGPQTTVFEVDIGLEDYGKLLGSKGKTISALRVILLAMSASQGFRAIIAIKDESRFF